MNIAVIGAGIGGLVFANLLNRVGVRVRVFERAPALVVKGAGITLGANALRALDLMGMANQVLGAGSAIGDFGIDDATGRPLVKSDLASLKERMAGYAPVAVHRARLHRILCDALPQGTVSLDCELTHVEELGEEAVAHFSNGSSYTADLLVGADGLRSRVRRSVLGEPLLRYAGQHCFRGVCASDAAPTRRSKGSFFESWGRGVRFGYVDIGFGETYWYATIAHADEHAAPLTVSLLPQRFSGFHAAAQAYIEATPADAVLSDGIFDIAPAKHWSSRRVVLLGDAIHPTTPNMGQGAGMAIESAVVLAAALQKQQKVADALRLYQHIRKPRTSSVTQGSRRIGGVTSWSQGLACGLRDWSMRLTPAKTFERQLSHFAVQDFSGGLVTLPCAAQDLSWGFKHVESGGTWDSK